MSGNGIALSRGAGRRAAFDYLIVGAGYAGSVLAERLARGSGKQVLLVDRRGHIGGNAYDCYDDAGILIHRYGPHIFHTNSKDVFDYLSRFTAWRQYQHKVLAHVDGQLVPVPINLDTINRLYGLNLNSFEMETFLAARAEPVANIRTSEDVVVSKVGRELYEKLFRGYTRKQWGLDPSELDAQVTARVPTRTNRDDRYFADAYQAMPKHGFTRLFENLLDHPNIHILLNTDYRDIRNVIPYRELIYTGPVDEFFDYRYGKLPYRCLDFKHETLNRPQFQPVGGDGSYHIPLDALHALNCGNLWVGGRVIGCDEQAYGSLRVMGTAFATGQAAGVAAAGQADGGGEPAADSVRRELRRQGAIF